MPFEIQLDVNPELWSLAKVTALPPVSSGHPGGGHAQQHGSDTVRLSRAAEILQLAEDGHTAAAIAQALGLPQDTVAAILASGHDSTKTAPQAIPLVAAQAVPPAAAPGTTNQGQILVEAVRDANGNLVPTPVPIAVSLAEAPPLAGPPGMPNPTVERRHRRRRHKNRRASESRISDPLWRWPLAESVPNPALETPDPYPDPWRHVGQDEVLEAAAHEWTDADGTPIPGGRLALPEAISQAPEPGLAVSTALVQGLARRLATP